MLKNLFKKKIFQKDTVFETYMLEYADVIDKAIDEFSTFINAFDYNKVNDWVIRMKEIERSSDMITHKMMIWLESTFIVNYDREDIHRLSSGLDDIIDYLDGAARRLSLYDVKEMIPGAIEFTKKLTLGVREVTKAVRAITNKKLSRDVLDICKNIKTYEEEGDKIYHDVLASLFKDEKNVLNLIKFKEVMEDLERSLDKCNQAAMNIESIIFKYS